MHIRRPAPPDRDAILALLRSDETFHDSEIDVAMELVEIAIARPGGDYDMYVCEADGQVVGYVCYGPTPMTDGTFDLYWIATLKAARGRGVARRLVDAMEHELRQKRARIVRIETSQLEAYGAARSFYVRLSYHEVGRIPDFYRSGDDLIILAKRLEAQDHQLDFEPARVGLAQAGPAEIA
jgi:ribosomal protein S18 acetylase RimI-like enzyme